MFEVLTTLDNKSPKGNNSIKKINTNKKTILRHNLCWWLLSQGTDCKASGTHLLSHGGLLLPGNTQPGLKCLQLLWLLKQLECPQTSQAVHPSRRAHFPVHTSNMVIKENRQKDQRCKWTKEFLQTPGQGLTKHIFAVPILAQQDLIIAMDKWLLCVSLYSLFWMRLLIEVLLFFLH